jgi:hypothetical protein
MRRSLWADYSLGATNSGQVCLFRGRDQVTGRLLLENVLPWKTQHWEPVWSEDPPVDEWIWISGPVTSIPDPDDPFEPRSTAHFGHATEWSLLNIVIGARFEIVCEVTFYGASGAASLKDMAGPLAALDWKMGGLQNPPLGWTRLSGQLVSGDEGGSKGRLAIRVERAESSDSPPALKPTMTPSLPPEIEDDYLE